MIGVVKIGGAAGNRLEPLADEIARRVLCGEQWIVVHGASGVMNDLCEERGVAVRMVTSPSGYRSRFVGERERELFREAALAFGARIAALLEERGVQARQADPEETPYASAARKDFLRESVGGRMRILRGNYSGTIKKSDGGQLAAMLAEGVTPVVPPLAADIETGLSLNVDGDRLAAQIAAAVGAERLVILSNVPGLMRDLDDAASLITEGRLSEWDNIETYAAGNMKRKLVACREALEMGLRRVWLADGRAAAPITNAFAGNSTCLAR